MNILDPKSDSFTATLSPHVILRTLEASYELQELKVFNIARQLYPSITLDDLKNPHDFELLHNSQTFQYEDGVATGLLMAITALRALYNDSSS